MSYTGSRKAMQAKAKADAENAKNSNAPSKLQRRTWFNIT